MGCFPSKATEQATVVPANHGKSAAAQQPMQTGTNGEDASKQQEGDQHTEAVAAASAQPDGTSQESCSPVVVLYKDIGLDLYKDIGLGEAPIPANEQQRFSQLCSYNILDTEPEEEYDRITRLCKTLYDVPISMVTFVDKDRVWIKSVQGLSGLKQVERRQSLCAWTLLSRHAEALVVPDLLQDVRFKDSPIVTNWPRSRFYAACPLVASNGSRLGTLCILDSKPRDFSADNITLLTQLANMVMREVERKRAMNGALCGAAVRHSSGSSIGRDRQGLMLVDMATSKWPIHLVNDTWERVTGISQELAVGSHFWDLFEPPPPAQVQAYQLAIEQQRNFELRVPANANPHMNIGQQADALFHSSSSSVGQVGSKEGPVLWPVPALQTHSGSEWCIPPSAAANIPVPTSSEPVDAVLAATAAAAERSQALHVEPRRASFAGGMRYVRFQFRSVSSVGSHMAPAVSVPPALVSMERTNYYWATVDVPSPCGEHLSDGQGSYHFGSMQQQQQQQQHGQDLHALSGGAGSTCPSSGHYTLPSSDSGSAVHPPLWTTFCLLPEDNLFQDITIGSLLGWGSYGRVHRGYWNGSLVAVKVWEQVAGDLNPRSSLEPLLHHRLSHPHIVTMYDVCTQEVDVCDDGRPLQEVWMVLEYCNRGTLSDAIVRGWLLSVQDGVMQPGQVDRLKALTTAREVSAAMEYLHSQNVLHGDLNGNNILLAGTGAPASAEDQRGFTAKVADFGLSRLLTPESEKIITKTHGTITHMAPEVITESTHSKAADVYSFGVVLFELISGVKPYAGMHYAQIVASITTGKLLQLLPEKARSFPAALKELMAACLASNPAERPTFAYVHAQLQKLEQQLLKERHGTSQEAVTAPGVSKQQPVQPVMQQQRRQQVTAPKGSDKASAAAVAAAAAAAVTAAASAAESTTNGDSKALLDVIAAAQQQSPPPGSVRG